MYLYAHFEVSHEEMLMETAKFQKKKKEKNPTFLSFPKKVFMVT